MCMTGMAAANNPTSSMMTYPDRRSASTSVPYSNTTRTANAMFEGRALKHCVGRSRGVAVRDAGARRTAIGVRHHAARRVVSGSHARHAHEGGTLRRDRQVHRRLLLRLDTLGARRARGLHLHPLGARTVESTTGPAPVVQQPEHGKARRTG